MRTDGVIPWVTLRSTEKADSRWDYDKLGWRRYRWNSDTSGAPVWRELHSIRQRQSIDDGLCQVCGRADADVGRAAALRRRRRHGAYAHPGRVSHVLAGGEPPMLVPCAAGSGGLHGRVETHGVIGDVYAIEGAAATAIAFPARGGRFACQPAT